MGLVPNDGLDREDFALNPLFVQEIYRCFGALAVSDGINQDTVSQYMMSRGFMPNPNVRLLSRRM